MHATLASFEEGLRDDPGYLAQMFYAYAALKSGVPYANGAPNLTVDIPAIMELAQARNAAISARISRPARPS